MQRVMIVGGPGAGKSTLARKLGRVSGLPVHHMDMIHWMPCWEQRSMTDKWRMTREVEAQDRWIFEGGFSATYDSRAARADTLIWIDLPVGLRLWRVTKRVVRYWGRSRPDLPQGCVEGVKRETWAFYKWIWKTRHSHRRRLMHLLRDHDHLVVHHLRSQGEIRRFLRQFA